MPIPSQSVVTPGEFLLKSLGAQNQRSSINVQKAALTQRGEQFNAQMEVLKGQMKLEADKNAALKQAFTGVLDQIKGATTTAEKFKVLEGHPELWTDPKGRQVMTQLTSLIDEQDQIQARLEAKAQAAELNSLERKNKEQMVAQLREASPESQIAFDTAFKSASGEWTPEVRELWQQAINTVPAELKKLAEAGRAPTIKKPNPVLAASRLEVVKTTENMLPEDKTKLNTILEKNGGVIDLKYMAAFNDAGTRIPPEAKRENVPFNIQTADKLAELRDEISKFDEAGNKGKSDKSKLLMKDLRDLEGLDKSQGLTPRQTAKWKITLQSIDMRAGERRDRWLEDALEVSDKFFDSLGSSSDEVPPRGPAVGGLQGEELFELFKSQRK